MRRIGGLVIGAVAILSAWAVVSPLDHDRVRKSSASSGEGGVSLVESGGATYEETRTLTGQELAEALRLTVLPGAAFGERFDADPARKACMELPLVGELVETGFGGFYCPTAVASSELEEWDLGQRLQGEIPTELEIEAWHLDQRGDAAYSEGNDDLAKQLWSEAHDLRVQSDKGSDS